MEKKISDLMDFLQDDSVALAPRGVASSAEIKAVAMKKLHTENSSYRTKPKFTRTALIAAVIALVLSVSAFAIYNFALRDLKGPTYQINGKETASLSLSNIKGSPEYEAAQEWEADLNTWFKQGKNMVEPGYVSDAYSMYDANSQEAKKALDALLNKYHLKMHEEPSYSRSLNELYSAMGYSGFMPGEGNNEGIPVGGAYYKDGTFNFCCSAAMPDGKSVGYQFYSFTKGTFTRTGNLLANADDFEEWSYTTKSGKTVLLAMSSDKSIVVANLDKSFVFVNILSGSRNMDTTKTSYGADTINKSNLEAFADSIDFEALNAHG